VEGASLDIALEKKPSLPSIARRPRHVHNITDRFSMNNTYLIDDGRLIIVDPGSILNARLTLDYLQRFLHRSPAEIDLLVLTHLQPDQSAGIATLRQACQAPVAASIIARHLVQKWRGEEPQLEKPQAARLDDLFAQVLNQRQRGMPGTLHYLDFFSPSYERQMHIVDLWLDDVAGLPNHSDWRVIASPGHTPESLCLYNPFSYELLCGDTAATIEGGSTLVRSSVNRRLLEETLDTLRNLQVYYLYPGNGRPVLSRRALSNASIE
jgi:hydroxyacylglutathione hydrolase